MGLRKLREFNIAMLGKEAWRLIDNPNSLVARIYKAKYFPRTNFMDATIGSNPSFIWHSILEAQPFLRRTCRWRVGDGESINIWTDPWLPNKEIPLIQSSPQTATIPTKVAALLHPIGNSWNFPLINTLFN